MPSIVYFYVLILCISYDKKTCATFFVNITYFFYDFLHVNIILCYRADALNILFVNICVVQL